MSYEETKRKAQHYANQTGYDYSLILTRAGWVFSMLCRRENRTGFELKCEVVMCEDLKRCKPGHGPVKQ